MSMLPSINIEEELFCIKFELDALSEVTLKNEAERWIPGFIHEITQHDHIERYKLATEYAANRDILDIACGVGLGSFILKSQGKATSVLGCDLDVDAIRYAKHRNSQEKVAFQVENAEEFISNKKFDVIVSFETIEHLPNYRDFLKNAKVNLKNDGLLIISTPISRHPLDNSPTNPYHLQEWGFVSFQNLLAEYFIIEDVYTQMYQNEFYNEKIKKEYEQLSKPKRKNFFARGMNKVFNIEKNGQIKPPEYRHSWNSKGNHSIIEKFNYQFEIDKLGSYYSGYQIVICKK